MDERVRHMIEVAVAVIVLLVVIDLFIVSNQMTHKGLQQVYEVNAWNDRDLRTSIKSEGDYDVTGADIISVIGSIAQFDVPIIVEGNRYEPGSSMEDMDLSVIIVEKRYTERVERSSDGAIQAIIYES
ncbi:hypothetical protein [Paenibacillus guangzhouensis]|uniref:hypothetical protein n=1 Tax=Paenibacillus guangzhouensis TaxID=1473112 RepID=UPI001266A0ED|nr:hypothetical protein [Paenibacillus guangzhouensis]